MRTQPAVVPAARDVVTPDARRPAATATATALAGALLLVAAPAIGVVRPTVGGADLSAAVVASGAPLLAVLLALAALARGRTAAAGAALGGLGAVALGVVVADLALWTDTINANRLELFRPLTAAHLGAGPGAAAVLAGHLLLVVAGAIGLIAVGRAAQADGYGQGADPALDGAPAARRLGPAVVTAAVLAALLVLLGALAEPWSSADPVLVVHPLLGSDAATAIGIALAALAVPIVVAAALSSESTEVAAAALVGAGLGALAVFGSRVAAGGDLVSPSAGSVAAALGGLLLVTAGAASPILARRGAPQDTRARSASVTNHADRHSRAHTAAGVAGVLSGLLAVAGSFLPVLTVPGTSEPPQVLATRIALVAGAILLVVSTALLLPAFAATVRPAVGIVWVAQLTAVSTVLQVVVVALDVAGIGIGAGAVVLALAALGAVVTGVLCWRAGAVERESIDRTADVRPRAQLLVAGLAAAAASALALALPLYTGPDYAPATVTDWPWGWDIWGRAVLAVALVLVAVVISRARPARAVASAVGGAVAIGVYLSGWPLTSGRIAEPEAGPGAWAAIMGVALFVVTAILAARQKRP